VICFELELNITLILSGCEVGRATEYWSEEPSLQVISIRDVTKEQFYPRDKKFRLRCDSSANTDYHPFVSKKLSLRFL